MADQRKTQLIPKSGKTENANNYRPITCLNTAYKIITEIIFEIIYDYFTNNDLTCVYNNAKNTYLPVH